MSAYVPRVFISATSQDLSTYRQAVRAALDVQDIHGVVQENRPPEDRDIVEAIRAWLAPCDAVICLIGFAFGGAPPGRNAPRRSYTQLEHDLAVQMNKPVFVFLARADCPPDAIPTDTPDDLTSQLEYRRTIQEGGIPTSAFSSVGELVALVVKAVPAIRQRLGPRTPLHYLNRPDRAEHFVGREQELEDLTHALEARDPCLVAIVGLGGQGKTTLVLEWLLRPDAVFNFDAMVWCTASRGFTFDEFLDGVLAHIDPRFDKRDEPAVEKRLARVMDWLQRRRLLIVVDGLERWLSDRSPGVTSFIRQASSLASGTHVLFTARTTTGMPDDLRMHHVTLGGLDEASALRLLRALGVRDADDIVAAKASHYRHHPLSLRILGRLASNEYGGWLARAPKRVVESGELHQLLVETCRALPERARAERLLQIAASCFESPGTELVAAVMEATPISGSWTRLVARWRVLPEREPRENAGRLAGLRRIAVMLHEWQLLTWDSDGDVLRLHPIIREFFAHRAPDAPRLHRTIARWYVSRNRRLAIEHAFAARELTWCAEMLFGPIKGTQSYLDSLVASGDVEEGELLVRRLAGGSAGILRAQFLLAAVYLSHEMNRFRETLDDLEECRRVFASATGDVECRINLAKTYASRGNVRREVERSTDAVDDLTFAIDLLNATPPHDHKLDDTLAVIGQTYMNRANALLDLGAWSRASYDYDVAGEVLRVAFLEENAELRFRKASLLANRGIVRGFLGALMPALDDFETAIALSRTLLAEGYTRAVKVLAHALVMKGAAYRESGAPAEGLDSIDEAIRDLEKLVSAGRTNLQSTLALAHLNRASTHLRLRNWVEAVSDADTAADVYRGRLREDRSEMKGTLAHALAIGAEARFHLSDVVRSRADRAEAFATMRKLIDEWQGETDIQLVFLETAGAAVSYLVATDPAEARRLANDVADELRRATLTPGPEGLTRQMRRTAASLLSNADALHLSESDRRSLSAIGVH